MVRIEIHNNSNVSVVTDQEAFASYLDNKGNIKTKYDLENGVLLLGKLPVVQNIAEYFAENKKE